MRALAAHVSALRSRAFEQLSHLSGRSASEEHGGGLARFKQVDLKRVMHASIAVENRMTNITKAMSPAQRLKAERLMHLGRLYNVVGAFLWQTKAQAVMLVGVAVKLAIYKPTSKPDAPYAAQQRIAVGLPIVVVFSIQIVHSLAIKNYQHYFVRNLTKHKLHLLVLLSRVVLLGAAVAVCFLPIKPMYLLPLEAALISAQSALIHLQEETFAISSDRAHPMGGMSDALTYLHRESYLENFSARGGLAGVLEEGTAAHGRHGHAPQHHGNHGHQTHKENEVKQGGDKENEVKQRA